jgi:hypothetical protein
MTARWVEGVEAIEMSTEKGLIYIRQDGGAYHEDQTIVITPQYVETIMKWLHEAKQEVELEGITQNAGS